MQHLIDIIGKYLLIVTEPFIKHPEAAELRIASSPDGQVLRFRLLLEQCDVAHVIGRNGMTASAIRSLAKSVGERHGLRVVVQVISKEEA